MKLTSETEALLSLFPIIAVDITLRFRQEASLPFFHQPILASFLKSLLPTNERYHANLAIDCPECGIAHYDGGSAYRFSLFGFGEGGRDVFEELLRKLYVSPDETAADDVGQFAGNVELVAIHDFFTSRPHSGNERLSSLDSDTAMLEIGRLKAASPGVIELFFTSPCMLLREATKKTAPTHSRSAQFVHSEKELSLSHLCKRTHDALSALLCGSHHRSFCCPAVASGQMQSPSRLIWADFRYRDISGARRSLGGALGCLHYTDVRGFNEYWLLTFLLGSYLGIGWQRNIGFGRYQFSVDNFSLSPQRSRPFADVLTKAAELENMKAAYKAIRANQAAAKRAPALPISTSQRSLDCTVGGDKFWDSTHESSEDEGETAMNRLEKLRLAILNENYVPPPLRIVTTCKKDSSPRQLSIPPFYDRVLQRAVAQVVSPAIDSLMYEGSFGYRPGLSRHNAAKAVVKAYEDGYHWVFEADIESFFDSVSWDKLSEIISFYYPFSPAAKLLKNWMMAPTIEGEQMRSRTKGLPQGAPLSPVLANLLLDDFDSDLSEKGFRLIRYADDFLVLCKEPEQAKQAVNASIFSLAEISLSLKEGKSAIKTFSNGFKFLGYVFLNGLAFDSSARKEKASFRLSALPQHSALNRGKLLARPARQTKGRPANSFKLSRVNKSSHNSSEFDSPGPSSAGENPTFADCADWSGVHKATLLNTATSGQQAVENKLPNEFSPIVPPFSNSPLGKTPTASHADQRFLFITGPVAVVSTQHERLVLRRDREEILSRPWRGLDALILIGPHHITTPALREAIQYNVLVFFASGSGAHLGVCSNNGDPRDRFLWIKQQEFFRQPAECLKLSKQTVKAKVLNSRALLNSRKEHYPEIGGLGDLDEVAERVDCAKDLEELNGLEGRAAALYFAKLRCVIPEAFGFKDRNRHPPRDPFNSMLSLGYTTLYNYVETTIHATGLLPWLGFYHQGHGQHAALASDLMEPFRWQIERTALNVIARRVVSPEDFVISDGEGCLFEREAKKRYLAEITDSLIKVTKQQTTVLEQLTSLCGSLVAQINGEKLAFEVPSLS